MSSAFGLLSEPGNCRSDLRLRGWLGLCPLITVSVIIPANMAAADFCHLRRYLLLRVALNCRGLLGLPIAKPCIKPSSPNRIAHVGIRYYPYKSPWISALVRLTPQTGTDRAKLVPLETNPNGKFDENQTTPRSGNGCCHVCPFQRWHRCADASDATDHSATAACGGWVASAGYT
jgi:hypothetical protein